LGHEVNLVSPIIDTDYSYNQILYWNTPKQLQSAVKLINSITDVFVVHNEPTWPVSLIREALPDAKIVLDYHDSVYWYFDRDAEILAPNEKAQFWEEDYSVSMCDGFVLPSEACRDELRDERHIDKPMTVLPPACPRGDNRYLTNSFSGGLTVQGGHAVPGSYGRLGSHWRDYTKLYKYLEGRCNVFAYTPGVAMDDSDVLTNHYKNLVTMLEGLPYADLINKLGQHSWNLVGNWCEHRVWKFSAPNKFYDALAAGVPSVVFHTASVKDLVEEEGIGISVTHPDEMLARWDECIDKRTNLMLKREKFCMERFIGRAEDLYREVIHA